jgi:serine/threonine protein kinase
MSDWSDVWVVSDAVSNTKQVVKKLRYTHKFTQRNYDRNRRDALALERLTSSKYVVDIYGYCHTAGVVEYSDGGDMKSAIWPKKKKKSMLSPIEKLRIATQGAMGLAALHNVDKEGRASIAHTDIGSNQFILIDGRYKLNDFNRARFILRNKTDGSNCPYFVSSNPGNNRSPEEYKYDPESEKVSSKRCSAHAPTSLTRNFLGGRIFLR